LIIVAAIAALVLAGMIALVMSKTRASRRNINGTTIRDQAEEDALRLRRQEMLADEFDARAHAARVEIDIKTVRACSLQQQATMMAHPLALQLRNLQTLAELGVEKNTTVVFPAPMMSAIGEISSFLARETAAAQGITPPSATTKPSALPAPVTTNGEPANGAAV
jgi:hypothetical protein